MAIVEEEISEVVVFTDTVSPFAELVETIEESLDLADTITPIRTLDAQVDESLGFDDDPTGLRVVNEYIDEVFGATDEIVNQSSSTSKASGYYRISNDLLARYEIYLGTDAEPDITDDPVKNPPYATFTGISTELSLAYDHQYIVYVRNRDESGLVDGSVKKIIMTIDDAGIQVVEGPSPPYAASISGAADGDVRLRASYNAEEDTIRADQWKIYLTDDGSTPTSGDLYATINMSNQPNEILDIMTSEPGGWANGTVIKVKIKTFVSDGIFESANEDVLTHTIDRIGEDPVGGGSGG